MVSVLRYCAVLGYIAHTAFMFPEPAARDGGRLSLPPSQGNRESYSDWRKDMKNRILAVALALALVVGIVPAHAADVSPFTDVPTTHWAYSYVREAYDDGVINGTAPGVFSPNGVLSAAEFSVILARAYYAGEIERKTRMNWYNREVEVLDEHHVFDMENASMPKPEMSQPLKRYEMARMIWGIMRDQGATMPSAGEIEAAKGGISDISTVPLVYRDCVAVCFSLGIINGTAPGVFSGGDTMRRDAAAAVYCRTKAAIAGEKPGTVTPVPTPSTGPEPTPSVPVTGSVVGTMSTEKVTINKDSIKSHAPVVDYWSSQPAEIQAIADKDSFNAACQTIHDSEMILTQGQMTSAGLNLYYNYAVVAPISAKTQKNVDGAMGSLSGFGGTYSSYGSSYVFYKLTPYNANFHAAVDPILAQIDLTKDDRSIAEACVRIICDKLDYEVDGGANWINISNGTNPGRGDCESFARMLNQLLSVAGIPSMNVGGAVSGGNHAWVQVKLDGQWYVMDGTLTENNPNATVFTFAEHERAYGYNHSLNDSDGHKVARALIDAAYPD